MNNYPFIHLRTQSSYSLSQSSLKIEKIIDLAKQNNMPSLNTLRFLFFIFILTFPIHFSLAIVPFVFSYLKKSSKLLGLQKNRDLNPVKSNQRKKVSVNDFSHSFQKTKPRQENKAGAESPDPTPKTQKRE